MLSIRRVKLIMRVIFNKKVLYQDVPDYQLLHCFENCNVPRFCALR